MGKRKTPNELVEEGVGLVAKGLFRAKEQMGPQEARILCESAKNVLAEMWFDFYRLEQKVKSK